MTLTATAADAASGIASVELQRSPAGAGTWTTIGSDTSAPYAVQLDTAALADGLYDLRAVATDDGRQRRPRRRSSPTGASTTPRRRRASTTRARTSAGTVTLTSTASDSGSGVDTRAYEYRPPDGGAVDADSGRLGHDRSERRPLRPARRSPPTTPGTARVGARRRPARRQHRADGDDGRSRREPERHGRARRATPNDGGSGIANVAFEFTPADGLDVDGDARRVEHDAARRRALRPARDRHRRRRQHDHLRRRSPTAASTTTRRRVALTAARPVRERGRRRSVPVTATSPDHGLSPRSSSSAAATRRAPAARPATGSRSGIDASAPFAADWPVDADGNRALRAVARDLAGNTARRRRRHARRPHRAHRRLGHLRARLRRRRHARRSRPTNGTDAGSGVDAGSATLERADRGPRGRRVRLVERLERSHEPRRRRHRALRPLPAARLRRTPGTRRSSRPPSVVKVDTHPAGRSDARLLGARRQRSTTARPLYYRPGGGSFTLDRRRLRRRSPASPATPSRRSAPAGRHAGTGASRDYSFVGTPAEPGTGQTVTATNAAGLTAGTDFAVTADSTPPTGASVDYVDGYRTTASVALALDRGDATPAAARSRDDRAAPGLGHARRRRLRDVRRHDHDRDRSGRRRTPTSPSRAASAIATSWPSATRSATRPSSRRPRSQASTPRRRPAR